MKVVLVNDDRSLRWDDVPNPILGNDDCLVKIEAAALNRADLMQREGDYPPPAGYNANKNNPWGSGRVIRVTKVGRYGNYS